LPPRERVVGMLVQRKIGRHMFRSRFAPGGWAHVCETECGLPHDNEEAKQALMEAYAEADETFCKVMQWVEWDTVMMVAVDRHRQARKADPQHLDVTYLYGEEPGTDCAIPCGVCVTEAVLSLHTAACHWIARPDAKSPRERSNEEFGWRYQL